MQDSLPELSPFCGIFIPAAVTFSIRTDRRGKACLSDLDFQSVFCVSFQNNRESYALFSIQQGIFSRILVTNAPFCSSKSVSPS